MPETNQLQHCDKCGAILSGFAEGQLCAACLLESAILEPETVADVRPAVMPLLVFNDYELLEEIARGGMGVVYRARQISLNRTVAVKMILGGHLANAAEMKRFRAEAETAAQLRHPNIVAIHEVGEHSGQPFFSMDMVQGQNLAQLVRDEPLPARKAATYLKTIAEAIQYAHSHGVLHRDLKPSNVLIDENDEPRITDFGLAKRLTDAQLPTPDPQLTQTGQVLGSPSFIPPEQAAGLKQQIGPGSDVYSLGAILYQGLTARPPFMAESLAQTLRLVAEQEPVPPRLLNASVPRDLETICLKCLEKDPTRRYPSAQKLADDLGRFLKNEPIHARPVSLLLKAHRWCVRNKPLAISGTVILVLLLAVAVVATIGAVRLSVANHDGQEKLRAAYLAQARANRLSDQAGRRFHSLEAISNAVAIHPGSDLRDEAIAALALSDVRPVKTWDNSAETQFLFDVNCENYFCVKPNGAISKQRVTDDVEVLNIASCGIPVHEIQLSPDDCWLAAHYRSTNGLLGFRLYDLKSNGRVCLDIPQKWVRTVRFSPGGTLLALSWTEWEPRPARSVITFYDLDTFRERNSIATDWLPFGVEFSPDGHKLAVGSTEAVDVQIFSVPDGQLLQNLSHSRGTYGLAWNAQGTELAVASADGNLYLWDWFQRSPAPRLLHHQATVVRSFFHPQGQFLLTYSWDQLARIWNTESAEEVLTIPASNIGPFSSTGQRVGINQNRGRVGLFEFVPGAECRVYVYNGPRGGCRGAVYSPDGARLISAHEDGLRVLDLRTGNLAGLAEAGDTDWLQFTDDGRNLITSGAGALHSWRFELHPGLVPSGSGLAGAASFHPDTPGVVTSSNRMLAVVDRRACIFDPATLRIEQRLTTSTGITEGTLSADRRYAATWSRDTGIVDVWNAENGRHLTKLTPNHSPHVSFSPDGRWLVTATADEYTFWEVGTWVLGRTIPRGITGATHGKVAFTPDSAVVALAVDRGRVGLYDAHSLTQLATLEPPKLAPITDLVFSPSGEELVVCMTEPMIYRWDLKLLRQGLAGLGLDFMPARPKTLPADSL